VNKTKVLIVEDEVIVALELKIELEKLNCQVLGMLHTKKDVLHSISNHVPDIILMDIKLGKHENGIDMVKEIQKTYSIPILYLTAFSDDLTMQRAFSTNPIGYIIKPFKTEELKTNIQLSMYKLNQNKRQIINENFVPLGEEFYFDMENKQLYFQNNFIKLGKKEKILLSILIEANHSEVPFSTIIEVLWNGNPTSTGALRTLVYRLKGKLGNNIIEVSYGYGYSLRSLP
jgi:DNA-binding response OmpR family regulator